MAAAERAPTTRRLVLFGTTAAGKSQVALTLAERLDGEIVGADSRQIYRGLTIGAAAPTEAERARIPHHFVAFLDPGEVYSAGRFGREARAIVAEIEARGRTAIIVGGSGLYLRALLDGLFEGPARDPGLRARLHAQLREEGLGALREKLARVDPEALSGILPGDSVRVIRALEIWHLTGRPISALRRERPSGRLRAPMFGIRWPRERLAERIEARVRRQMASGFLEEARRLAALGLADDAPAMRTLGYVQLIEHVRGLRSLEEAVREILHRTRQLAKRQETWFRRISGIAWLEVGSEAELLRLPDRILERLDAGSPPLQA
ncbi:MAG TPA: tRNA (adenosine(37)-N6)-dimethylallyltransferase MiaA [Candidatus Eisenbacteria bacterium]